MHLAHDVGEHIRVANGPHLNQVHRTFEQPGEVGLKPEEFFERRQIALGFEFDQKVGVAAGGVEIVGARGGAEDLKMSNTVTLAKCGDVCALFLLSRSLRSFLFMALNSRRTG